MQVYLVGGAVRDEMLGRPVHERDWVVLGATPEEMKAKGYRQVGRDFPVFLHPDTQEEYALARTERKSAPGHTGFTCHFGPEVSLEDDLRRRDLTINAMARDRDGALVDPYGGAADLSASMLRHVSPAFEEDPLRVLRLARFAAQLPRFQVAPETRALLQRMSAANALAELSAERVWRELYKALDSEDPERFFGVLTEARALSPWLAELEGRTVQFPPALRGASERFASIGWLLLPQQVDTLSQRLRAPKREQRLARRISAHGRCLARWRRSPAEEVLTALSELGVFRDVEDAGVALGVVEACADVTLAELRALFPALKDVSAKDFDRRAVQGPALGEAIRARRGELLRLAQER